MSFFVGADIWQYNPGGISPSLVGYWKLDGNANDSSGNDNHGTITGATYTNKGRFGGAYEFDGKNDRIQVANSTTLNFGDKSFSEFAWIKRKGNGDGTYERILGRNLFRFDFTVKTAGQVLAFYEASSWRISTLTISNNVWTHIGIVWNNATNQYTVYKNGIGEVVAGNPPDVREYLLIGDTYGANVGNFNGTIDEVRIYNRSLSASEILELYNESRVSHSEIVYGSPELSLNNDPNLVAQWKLDGNANDSSSNNNDGTVTSATYTNKGRFKSAYEFDGINTFPNFDRIDIPYSNSLNFTNTTDISISLWAKGYAGNDGDNEIYGMYYNINDHINLRQSGNNIRASIRQFASLSTITSTNGEFIDNKWHHLVIVADRSAPTNFTFYIDGNLIGSADVQYPAFPSYQWFRIGCGSHQAYTYNGIIDEVRIYNRSLTASEILELYNTSKNSYSEIVYGSPELSLNNDPTLAAHWKLDGNANDSTSNNNDGTITGANYTNKGRFKGAYHFDGINQYINIPNSDLNLSTPFTISTWIKYDDFASPSVQWIIGKAQSTPGATRNFNIYSINDSTNNEVLYFGVGNGTVHRTTQIGDILENNKWFLATGVYNGSNILIYLDGIYKNTTSFIGTPHIAGQTVSIGYDLVENTFCFNGTIDEIMIFNRSLSGSEILQLYNTSKNSYSEIVYGSGDAN